MPAPKTMTRAHSDFAALKILVGRARVAPADVGWYLLRAYRLGEGAALDEVMARPPGAGDASRLEIVEPEEA